jgi:hypothetical protein
VEDVEAGDMPHVWGTRDYYEAAITLGLTDKKAILRVMGLVMFTDHMASKTKVPFDVLVDTILAEGVKIPLSYRVESRWWMRKHFPRQVRSSRRGIVSMASSRCVAWCAKAISRFVDTTSKVSPYSSMGAHVGLPTATTVQDIHLPDDPIEKELSQIK